MTRVVMTRATTTRVATIRAMVTTRAVTIRTMVTTRATAMIRTMAIKCYVKLAICVYSITRIERNGSVLWRRFAQDKSLLFSRFRGHLIPFEKVFKLMYRALPDLTNF